MDFDFSEQEEAFRAEVRAFIAENLPPEDQRGPEFQAQWDAKLVEKKWIGFALPEEDGGGGGSLVQQFILKEEMSKALAPPIGNDFMGLAWVAPALVRHGSEEQKQRFLPDLLNARSFWCTGYSEPDVGSDLASVKTRAVRDGDDYVINGSKIWTSSAHEARWMFMLARTDPDAESRYRGTSCLLVPMDAEGIEVRPIRNLAGLHHFNQVFFTDVHVPVGNRLGKEGEGWRVIMGALADERSGISEAHVLDRKLDALKDLARKSRRKGKPAIEDAGLRRELARYDTLVTAMRLNALRNLTRQLQGEPAGSETSVNKLLRGYLEIPLYDTAMGLLGNDANTWEEWQEMSLRCHSNIIGGGSPNIQRNIIAERILGLPKD
jgi:alkylation response protein AidB-like acyl-CoA dehydrogenase